jgi:HKD family nuclease
MQFTLNNTSAVSQGFDDDSKLHDVLQSLIEEHQYTRISVCSAYVSTRGLTIVRGLMPKDSEFRWLIGLDDTFTQPSALTAARDTYNATLKVAELQARQRRNRFHPKVYLLDSNGNNEAHLIIGSANMTEAALTRNCEAFSIMYAEDAAEVAQFESFWNALWNKGELVTNEIIDRYRRRFRVTRPRNPVIQEETEVAKRSTVLKRATEASIRTARLIWIEFGSMTGYHAEQVDIVKNLAPFLGITEDHDPADEYTLNITSPLGLFNHSLMFKKGMWRFMDIQQSFQEQLKPNPEQNSPYILIIERENNTYSMRILRNTSPEAKRIIATSKQTGFTGKSVPGQSGRLYGWF